MFSDLQPTINNYVKLKTELQRVEAYLKKSLKDKLKQAKTDDILETIINLLNTQESPEMIKFKQQMIESDIKDLTKI